MAQNINPITKQFITYNTKSDPSNSDQRYLVAKSQNVLINDSEKITSRQGFSLQSIAGTTGNGIEGSIEWSDSTGDELPMRAHDAVLEFYINGNWETLEDTLTSIAFIFDTYWDDTEKKDRLLWCDGSPNLYDWSGATAKLSSITATTVTLQGSDTFGQKRFLTTNTRAIRIKDDNGTWHRTVYTGGEGTTTLTGLDTDLTAFPFTGNNLIVQEVITRTTIIDVAYFIDFLKVIDNQVWLGSRTQNPIYFSKNTSVTDYSYSSPRAVGEGGKLTLDGPGRGIGTLRGDVILFAGQDFIYKSVFNQITVGTTLAETVKVERLKTTSRQGALHQNLIENIGNGLIWIGADNVMHELIDATLSYNPNLQDVSDPVKPDFIAADFTGGHMKFDKTRIYISAPASATNFIYEYRLVNNVREWFWQPPQTWPVNRWAVIGGLIHGHSSATDETYKLFDGYNDNDQAIHSIGLLARWNGGVRDLLKKADEMFNEGAISANTILSVSYGFDKDGGESETVTKLINGTSDDNIYSVFQDPSLGNIPEGDVSLSGDVIDDTTLPKFRIIHEINEQEFFDYGVMFETNDVDARWEILCHGSNSTLSPNKVTAIKN